ncbi:hypothetical protein D3C78_943560 [compost metagenome]
MRLPLLEEAHSNAVTAIAGQQHAFTEIKYPVRIIIRFDEGRFHLIGFSRHRHAGGHADHSTVIERQHEDRAVRIGIGREIFALIIQRTVIEIGKSAKHLDPQAREIIEIGCGVNAGKRLDFDGHGHFTFGCTGYTVMENPRKH